MRNLKRALSLALAAAMLISLMVIGASASYEDYPDASSIQNVEAVDFLTAVGVVGGDQNGNFNPTATLTRAEFCVMVANALTGGKFDQTLFNGAQTPFTDVQGHWGAGYIAYCYSVGVIAGTSATTFSPDNTLTAAQASAILLSALGYNQNGEFAQNGQFELNVTKWAQQAGLYDNLSVSATAGISRDNTAQLIFNALTVATPVGYSNLTEAYYTIGTSSVNGVVYKGNDNYNNVTAGAWDFTLASKNFSVDSRNTTVAGEAGYYWTMGGKDVTNFYSSDRVLATSMDGTEISKLTDESSKDYAASLETKTTTGYDGPSFYVNGVEITATSAAATQTVAVNGVNNYFYVTGNTLYESPSANTTGTEYSVNGAIVTLTDVKNSHGVTGYDGKAEKVQIIEKTAVKLDGDLKTSTSGSVTEISVPGIPGLSDVNSNYVHGYAGLVENDVVLYYTKIINGNTNYYIEKAQTVTGTLTASTTNNVTVDGTTYKASGLNTVNSNFTGIAGLANDAKTLAGTTFYLDNGGFIVDYKLAGANVTLDNTLFVVDAEKSGYTYQAKVVYMNGSNGVITVGKTADHDGSLKAVSSIATTVTGMGDGVLAENTFYTYTVDNGTYNLTACENQKAGSNSVTKGTPTVATGILANASTAFVLQKGSVSDTNDDDTADKFNAGGTNEIYTGVSNTANYENAVYTPGGAETAVTAETYVLYNSKNYAMAVVGLNGVLDTSTTSDYTVVFAASNATTNYVSGGENYYTFKAVVNGEIVNAYETTSAGLFTIGGTYYVNGFDDGRADSKVSGDDAALIKTTGNHTGLKITDGTLNATGGSARAVVLSDDVQMFVFDRRDNANTIEEVTSLSGLAGSVWTLTTVPVSKTDSSIAYVFVTIEDVATPEEVVEDTVADLIPTDGNNDEITWAGEHNPVANFVISGDEIIGTYDDSIAESDELGETAYKGLRDDLPRLLGQLHEDGVTTITYNNETYTWEPDSAGNLTGSNWYGEERTLVADLTASIVAQVAEQIGLEEFEGTTLTALITAALAAVEDPGLTIPDEVEFSVTFKLNNVGYTYTSVITDDVANALATYAASLASD